jgi:hypothetical protein
VFLSHTLAEWFRPRPQLRLTCVVPINRDGTTVELHAWYECHVFPPTAEAPRPVQLPRCRFSLTATRVGGMMPGIG